MQTSINRKSGFIMKCLLPNTGCTLCSEKTPTHIFFPISTNNKCKNCSECTQGNVDSDNVNIRYSLRGQWCNYDVTFLAKVGASLQHAISMSPGYHFLRVQGACWRVDTVLSCIMWWNLRQFNTKQLFIHEPDWVRLPPMRDNVTATECCGWLIQIHICDKEKGGYFEHKLWHFNS